MIEKTLRKVSSQLETMAKNGVSVERALDLLEASTGEIEEIIAINILRESLEEPTLSNAKSQMPFPGEVADEGPIFNYHVA